MTRASTTRQPRNDSLYIVDGVDNEVVAVTNASNLLVKDEIVVSSHGTKFTCKQKKFTCASVVYRGSALNAPVASAFLPNGNLIVANTKGGNTLVELTLTGKVLATKKIDSSKNAHVFGLVASGTKNVVLFYTDTADNSVHELEPYGSLSPQGYSVSTGSSEGARARTSTGRTSL